MFLSDARSRPEWEFLHSHELENAVVGIVSGYECKIFKARRMHFQICLYANLIENGELCLNSFCQVGFFFCSAIIKHAHLNGAHLSSV